MSRPVTTGAWLLRWDTVRGGEPEVIQPDEGTGRRAEVFEAESGGFVVFDGYLFDRAVLGFAPSGSDVSLVASGYERWRDGLFDKLRGGFVAAIWDQEQRRLLVGRDAMGLMPCFYWWNERVVLVSPSLDEIGRAHV